MATTYNNGFPMSYQPYYSQYSYPNQTQQTNNGIIWVQGEAGAKSYLVAPNNTVQLWDSESQTIYLKSADASGMPSMRVLDYTIRQNTPQPSHAPTEQPKVDYPTREEFNALQSLVEGLQNKIDLRSEKDEKSSLQ